MHVLVIGGTRFVGRLLTWRLVAAGHRVTLVNRGTLPDPFGDRVERLHADRTTLELDRALKERTFDAAVDFALYTGEDARRAVDLLGKGRVRHYVMISTGQVYLVRTGCPQPARESDYAGPVMPRPADPEDLADWTYGIDKRQAEDVFAEAWARERFPATRLRIPMVNGERDYQRRLESYLWRMMDGGPVLLPDGGNTIARHVYAGSVVTAVLGLLGDERTFGQAYNLCQRDTPTIAELLHTASDALGSRTTFLPVSTAELSSAGLQPLDISPFSTRWMSLIDPARAEKELRFRHEPLPRYLDKIVTWFFTEHPDTPPENYAHRPAELALAARLGR